MKRESNPKPPSGSYLRETAINILKKMGVFSTLKKAKDSLVRGKTNKDTINKNYIRKLLPLNPVIIDAGAHKGFDSIEMCQVFRNPQIHCFEPVPAIYSTLRTNTSNYPQIKCYDYALSNKTGEDFINISSGASDASSSLLNPKAHLDDHPEVLFNQRVKVKTITLDDWAIKYSIKKVDFLWLDLQGYELPVLKASNRILPTVSVIHMEVSTRETYEGVTMYAEIRDWLINNGFRVKLEAIPEGWDMGNVLFVRG